VFVVQPTSKTSKKTSHHPKGEAGLTVLEKEVIAFFEEFAQVFGLSPSVAQIYGLLYCRATSISFEEIQAVLKISLGSTSQGLKLLQERGMVRVIQQKGTRLKKFAAEIGLGQIIQTLLREQVSPRLAEGQRRLQNMAHLLEKETTSDELKIRIQRLGGWTERAQEMLPLMLKLAGGS
jgi:DNA-binding transcriptional regulator GbsR (MarR family)